MELLDEDVMKQLAGDLKGGANSRLPTAGLLFEHLAQCLSSTHFQVQERSLYLWNNEHLVNVGCMSKKWCTTSLPVLYRPLYRIQAGHWNSNVESLAQNVLKLYMAYDLKHYNRVTQDYLDNEKKEEQHATLRKQQWLKLEQDVRAKTDRQNEEAGI